jgi:hypothetical protein
MVALLGVFGARKRPPAEFDAAAPSARALGSLTERKHDEQYRLRHDRLLPCAKLYQDPYPYYEYLRAHGPVWRDRTAASSW